MDLINFYPNRIAIIIIIITNFICNNLFLFSLKYYSDDWTQLVYPDPSAYGSLSHALLESQRPIDYALMVIGHYLVSNVLIFHLLSFLTTSIALVIVYLIFIRIFRDFGYENENYPFIASMLFCTLFNIDEIYAWPTLSFGNHSIFYLLTIYFYLNKEKKYFIGFSLFTFLIGLFSYEVGIAIPVFLLIYDYLNGKNWEKIFSFAIPLSIYLTIRFTRWFGYGWISLDRGFGTYGLGMITTSLKSLLITVYVFLINLINSVFGYTQMGIALIIFLFIINVIIIGLIYKYMVTLRESKGLNIKLIYLAFIMIFAFSFPYILRGGIDGATREFYLIDIGIALLIVCVLMSIRRYFDIKILAILIIALGIFINQGLYYNWVVSGDILENIDNFIGGNHDELLKYDYVYFNTSSYTENKPNEYNLKKLFKGMEYQLFGPPKLTSNQRYDNGYSYYYNAGALPTWTLRSMINERKKSPYTLIYDNYEGTIPINVTKDKITYKELPDGNISTVSRDKVFEINYSSVVLFNQVVPKLSTG